MNEYQRLLMYFKIFQCNLAILHHNITGDGFFEAHAELDRWQKENGKILDSLIEYGIALSYKEPTISESVLAFQTDVLPADKLSRGEAYGIVMEGMRSLAGMAKAAEASAPVDLQTKLQEYEDYWNLEANYKLAAALGKMERRRDPEYDD